jgi:protein-tyrosine phosphatase
MGMMMFKIRDWLYIGKYAHIRSKSNLESDQIGALLSLAEPVGHEGIATLYLNVTDGEPVEYDKIAAGVQFVRDQKAAGKRIVIACGAGISRSVMFTMAALMEEEGLSVFDAYREVYLQYRAAQPHDNLIISLAGYHGQELDLLDVWTQLSEVQKQVDQAGTGA